MIIKGRHERNTRPSEKIERETDRKESDDERGHSWRDAWLCFRFKLPYCWHDKLLTNIVVDPCN
jgi:hypothetical protein